MRSRTPKTPPWLEDVSPSLRLAGNNSCLATRPTAILCSRQCPGALILDTSDWVESWCKSSYEQTLASGFQTSVEKEILRRLLRCDALVARFPARSLPKRLPKAERAAVEAARMVIVSPFPESQSRPSKALARRRNELLLRIAQDAIVVHAAPNSATLQWAHDAVSGGLPLYTFDHPSNAPLFDLGAQPIDTYL